MLDCSQLLSDIVSGIGTAAYAKCPFQYCVSALVAPLLGKPAWFANATPIPSIRNPMDRGLFVFGVPIPFHRVARQNEQV